MKLEKLKIIPYSDNLFNTSLGPGIELMVNPSTYKISSSIGYSEDKSIGDAASSPAVRAPITAICLLFIIIKF